MYSYFAYTICVSNFSWGFLENFILFLNTMIISLTHYLYSLFHSMYPIVFHNNISSPIIYYCTMFLHISYLCLGTFNFMVSEASNRVLFFVDCKIFLIHGRMTARRTISSIDSSRTIVFIRFAYTFNLPSNIK